MSASSAAIRAPVARRSLGRRPRAAIAIGALSVLCAMVLAYLGSNVWASIHQNGLEERFDVAAQRWSTLDPVERSSVTYAPSDPIARLAIPSIDLDAIVVEGSTPAIMRRAPGHLPASATPGEDGVAIVAGNRLGFGSFFLRLDRLSQGDRIVTESVFGTTTYEVESVRVVGVESMDLGVESTGRMLVLFGSNRLWGGPDRIVVRARAVEEMPS